MACFMCSASRAVGARGAGCRTQKLRGDGVFRFEHHKKSDESEKELYFLDQVKNLKTEPVLIPLDRSPHR